MAKLSVKVGSTSQTVNVFIQDSSSTTGAGKTGLAFNTSGLTAYYVLPRAASAAITLATLAAATSAYSSGGFKEIDSTNMPGWYRFDIPDAALASGRFVGIHLQGVTNMAPCPLEIELTGFDNQSTTDGNLSKLTSLTFTGANKVDASVRDWVGDTIPARNVTGVPLVDAKYLLGTVFATPATAGILDANVKNMNNVAATAITTIKAVQGLATDGVIPTATNLTNAPTAGDFTAVMKTSIGTAVAASAVASVTARVTANTDQLAGQTVTAAAGVTFPTSVASPTNITAGTITTATNLTNAPTAGDFTAVMKTSIGTAVAASAVASVTAGVTVTTNNDKTGYSIASGGIGSGAHAAAELNAIADALLDRNMATGADNGTNSTVVRTVRQALRRLRNKESIAAGTGTITKEDDSTTSWTYAATTTAGDPLSSCDPT